MMRQFVPLACLGTVLLPAAGLALGGRYYYYPPCVPVVSCPPVVYYPVCPPACEVYAPAPVYAPVPVPAAPRPAAPTVTPEPTARPEAARPDATIPSTPVPTTPAPKAPIAPMPGVPRTGLDAPEIRPAEAVRIPVTAVPLAPNPPSVPLAQPRPVVPAGAVGPAAEPGRFPLVPRVPGGESALPPLQIVPPPEPSTSRSSPLGDRKGFEVVPVSGAAPAAGALRSVGIFNHTDRDVSLTVEGETVTLPKRSYVTAAVPRKFAWRLGGGEPQTTEVPADSPGVEIVLRR